MYQDKIAAPPELPAGIALHGENFATSPIQPHRELALQRAVSRAIAEDGAIPIAMMNVLRAVCILGNWDFGEVWLVDDTKQMLLCTTSWSAPDVKLARLSESGRGKSYGKGTSLLGRVWGDDEPVWLDSDSPEWSIPYSAEMAKSGMKTIFASPIIDRQKVLGVLTLSSLGTRPHDKAFRDLMMTVGNQIGEFVVRSTTESALKIHEKLFQALIENSSDVITLLSAEGKIMYATPAIQHVLGFEVSSVTGLNALQAIHPQDRAAARKMIASLLQEPSKSALLVYRVRHIDRSWKWMEAVGTNMLSDPAVNAIVANNRDITAYKTAEATVSKLNLGLELKVDERTAELLSANKELEAFSYSVAHDLRSPLRAINGFTKMLSDELAGKVDKEGERLLDVIQKNVLRMGHLIDDLLAFSRAGRKELEPFAKTNMSKIALEAVEEVKREAGNESVRVAVGDLLPIRCNAQLIRQVWVNLVSNALKFTRECTERKIEIGSQRGDGETVYFVKDNGIGFNMKHSSRLFGLFQRLHPNPTYEGTGVGLAIVKRIVQRHHGRVWAEGAIGSGATFYFTIPS
jgi:PAS domain S-box-containing protein